MNMMSGMPKVMASHTEPNEAASVLTPIATKRSRWEIRRPRESDQFLKGGHVMRITGPSR